MDSFDDFFYAAAPRGATDTMALIRPQRPPFSPCEPVLTHCLTIRVLQRSIFRVLSPLRLIARPSARQLAANQYCDRPSQTSAMNGAAFSFVKFPSRQGAWVNEAGGGRLTCLDPRVR